MADRQPSPAPAATAANGMPVPEDAIPGEYVFNFYDDNDRAAFEALARRLGIRVIDSMAVGHAVRIGVNDPRLLQELLAKGPTPIDGMPNIYMRIPERADTEPLAPETGYSAFGKNALAWLGIVDNSDWGRGVTVAVLDSGVAGGGSLSDVNISQVDFIGEGSASGLHGTAVASLIAGRDESVLGVAPGVDLLSVKVMSDAGTGDAFTVAKGIVEAVDRGADILCLCLGSRSSSTVLQNAVAYAIERDVLLVAAAGNDAILGISYPARYRDVVAVAAVDAKAEHLYFSNRGSELDVAAPGAGVAVSQPEGEAVLFSGTSVAVPFVVGTAAALLAENPGLKPDALAELITRYTNDAGAPGSDDHYGAGVLDVGRLTARDTAGILDMAMLVPYATQDDDGEILHIQVSAQNRGTESIAEVSLAISWNNALAETFTFYNVHLGQTISHAFSFPYHTVPEAGLDLQASVIPVGIADATPGNNGVHSLISVIPKGTE
jgi:subtilisin family serine protease